jgi:hypothetical protein
MYLLWANPSSPLIENVEIVRNSELNEDFKISENSSEKNSVSNKGIVFNSLFKSIVISQTFVDLPLFKKRAIPLSQSLSVSSFEKENANLTGESSQNYPSLPAKRKHQPRSRWRFLHGAIIPTCFASQVSRLMKTLSSLLANICSTARISSSKDSSDQERCVFTFLIELWFLSFL